MCLQEVTPILLKLLLDSPFVRETYYMSGNGFKGYGIVTLSKLPCRFFEERFVSCMGRSVLIAEATIQVEGAVLSILVANSHLESAKNREARKHQLG